MAAESQFAAVANRLCCLRGRNTLTVFVLAVEIDAWDRFTGHTIALYLGLVPFRVFLWHQQVPGRDQKIGNIHARRLHVEAAWHHKPQYRIGKIMTDRSAKDSPQATARGDAGSRRRNQC